MIGIALADFLTGYEISCSAFYLLAIAIALWFEGKRFAILISILSITSSIMANWAAGAHYSTPFIIAWNAVITMISYGIVIMLLSWLKSSQMTLEKRILERTAALTDQMAKRERLEKEILAVSEREQRRIGCDLHDNLCQHLTGTAITALIVEQDLSEMGLKEAAGGVKRVVTLVEEGISLAREIARGLTPALLDPPGLMDAFEELAATTTNRLKVECYFENEGPVLVEDTETAIHLYRIAQEAISNALRHGHSKRIVISFLAVDDHFILTIKDNGSGLPSGQPEGKGMGLRIMKHRAAIIGASLSVNPAPLGGTMVTCSLTDQTHSPRLAQDV
jgi:signal transduction histidine kinase